jgi:LysM repeat protein
MAAIIPASTWGRELRGTPPRLNLSGVTEMTVHYTGTARVTATADQIAARIKATERHHFNRTDAFYSAVGYNFAIDKWGRIWELRGFDYRNAANGTASNSTSFSVCVLVGVEDNTPTPEIVAALQALYAEGVRRTGRRLAVKGHQEHKATACPGGALQALVRSGRIQNPPPAPTPAPARPAAPITSTYTVARGDSYWGIAARLLGNGGRWKEISDLNNGRALTPGLVIRIPAAPATAPAPAPTITTYRVVSGDSYWSVSLKLYGTGTRWKEISDLNAGRSLHPGMTLRVRAT